MFTPSRQASWRGSAASPRPAWTSPKTGQTPKQVWARPQHVIDLLQSAASADTSVEASLHALFTIHRGSAEFPAVRHALRGSAMTTELLVQAASRADLSDTGARVREHVLGILAILVGSDDAPPAAVFDRVNDAGTSSPHFRTLQQKKQAHRMTLAAARSFDETLCASAPALQLIATAFFDPHFCVVYTAALLARKLSELPSMGQVCFFDDGLFGGLMRCLEHCRDHRVTWHVVCAVLNLSSNASCQFALARCARLMAVLQRCIGSAASIVTSERIETQGPGGLSAPGRFGAWATAASLSVDISHEQGTAFASTTALTVFANLLSASENNCSYIKAQYPGLHVLLATARACVNDDVAQAADVALRALHDADLEALEHDIHLHVAEGRAVAHRHRSQALDDDDGGAPPLDRLIDDRAITSWLEGRPAAATVAALDGTAMTPRVESIWQAAGAWPLGDTATSLASRGRSE